MDIKDTIIDVESIRKDFPILHQEVEGRPLVYFDNAASSQKPQVVIDAISDYYQSMHSNVHRGVHHLSQKATEAFEEARKKVQRHLNAAQPHEIIWTKGTTDGINLVATSLGQGMISAGDEIIISTLEHHSNIVPWQMLCERTGAKLRVIPIDDDGLIDMEAYRDLLNSKTKLVAVNQISNALGIINPIREIISQAHETGAWVLIDGAQSVPHTQVDVQEMDADFFVFSGHKVMGPTGIGVLYGKESLLEQMPPYQGGGEMIAEVRFEKTTYAELPHKFEAGTPHIAGAIGLGKAIDYLQGVGLQGIAAYEADILHYATTQLKEYIPGITIYGDVSRKASAISFLLEGIHPYDAGVILDKLGLAIRTGHHCNQPLMHRFGISGTMRASLAFYNTRAEVDQMIAALQKASSMLA